MKKCLGRGSNPESAILTSNRSVAENALFKRDSKLIKANKRIEYEESFKFWECNQIIDEVLDQKKSGVHFLITDRLLKRLVKQLKFSYFLTHPRKVETPNTDR